MRINTKKTRVAVLILIAIIAVGAIFTAATNDKRNFEIIKNLDIFYSVFREINSYYVDEPVPQELIRTAIDEMLSSLDPYTNYIPEEDMEDFRFMTTGEYGGVGAIISMSDSCYIMVRELYKDFPADRAGLIPGDYIIEVAGKDVKNFKVSAVSELLRGEPGTEVKIKVLRPETNQILERTAKREKIQINPVSYYGMVNNEIGYITMSSFTQDCSKEVEKAFIDLRDNYGAKKMILDLRGNPGGLMDEAIKMVNLFVPRGSHVMSTKGRVSLYGKKYMAPREPIDTIMPLAVLINRGSASASEIVAGALQDLDRAVIIGRRSYGKGLVQGTREIEYNGALKLTTAKYYIPSGRCVQALDYSHRDSTGAVGYVPDSLISEFQTKGGRKVYDGGGVSPDVHIDAETFNNITLALVSNDMIFRYAVKYRGKHADAPSVTEFSLTDDDYDDFCNFVGQAKNFTYKTRSNEQLKKLIAAAKADNYYEGNQELFDQLNIVLSPELQKDLRSERKQIQELIEEEILVSYHYANGATPYNFRTDGEIISAVELLADDARYNGLLDGTVASHAGDKRKANQSN